MGLKILNKQNVAETKFLNLVVTTYEDKKGKQKEWVSAERPGDQKAVVIVAIVPGGNLWIPSNPRLVVIKEFRVPLQGYEIGLPAGLIDPGHNIKETAVKELKEETGLDVVKFIRPPTPFVFNSPGITSEAISFAFVEAKGDISGEHLENSEDITTFLYTKEQIKTLLEAAADPGQHLMIGAKSWLIFEEFAAYGTI
jgi:ADP-ribose pyrophosphatase